MRRDQWEFVRIAGKMLRRARAQRKYNLREGSVDMTLIHGNDSNQGKHAHNLKDRMPRYRDTADL